jgi:cellobiose-specific phosphotransferase system component IIB
MRFSTLTLTALVFAAGAAGAVVASDDLTIVSKHTHDGKPAGTSTSYLASDHVRMAREEGHETIVDLKTGVMTTLDGKKKTYYTITKQDMEQLKVKMQEKMNSPEMKKAMEAMQSMSAGMSTSFDVKKMGTTRKIAGFSCEEWTITMGTLSTIRECVTSELQYPARAWDTYKDFSESMKNMTSAFGPMAKSGAELAEKLKNMKGFPVASSTVIEVMGNKTTIESEVIEVRKGSIPASAWEIPAGYTKIENPMLKAFEGHGPGRPNR